MSGGDRHTVLLRTHGRVVTYGENVCGQRNVLVLESGSACIANGITRDADVQILVKRRAGGYSTSRPPGEVGPLVWVLPGASRLVSIADPTGVGARLRDGHFGAGRGASR